MMLGLLVAVLESGSVEQWLPAKAGLEQLFPGDFGQVLRSPDRVVVELLTDETNEHETPFGPDETRFHVASRHEVTGPLRASVLARLSNAASWKAQNHRRCAPRPCVFVMLCGGFRPSVQVWLEKGARTARLLICLDCAEAWVDRLDADGRRVGREQAMLEEHEQWRQTFLPLALRPSPFPAPSGTSSSADAGTRSRAAE